MICNNCPINENEKERQKMEYFFYEWLILEKHIDEETFKKLSSEKFQELKTDFVEFYKSLS